MAKPVATVNGKKVYSNKKVNSIVNTRITFTDGSWCDVSTGEVSNRGDGYINIGIPGCEGEKKDRKEETYPIMPVVIRSVDADVSVKVANTDKISVVIEGDAEVVKNINISQTSGTLVIEGESGFRGRHGGITMRNISIGGLGRCSQSIVSSGSSIRISGGGITITSGDGAVLVKITVTLPASTKVSVSGVSGLTEIGDTGGDIEINANTGGDYKIGKVGNAVLNIQGSGDISVEEVNGNLNAAVQGSGDIDVKRGVVPMLTVSIQGSGDVDFGGQAENANLTVMGSGDIDVKFVKNRPITNVMGSGDIDVKNW